MNGDRLVNGQVMRRLSKREKRRARGERGAAVVTAAKKVPNPALLGDVALLNAITANKAARRELELELTRHVRAARRAGVSWQRIGDALGVTRQVCLRKWGPYPVTRSKSSTGT